MSVSSHLPGYRWFYFLRNAAVRTGVYIGVCLTLVFVTWLVIANHVPLLVSLAEERNLAAGAVFCFPMLRFLRSPANLLASSLIGWVIFSLSYRVLCLFFTRLSDWRSPLWVFMAGTVVYSICFTVCWIGAVIWRARTAHVSHPNHHTS